jgi:type II secretory pathway component PulC
MRHVEALLNRAVITPYAVKDRIEGLKITGLENVPVAGDLGLKNGDVIRAVNGQRLTSKQHAYQVFKKARTEPSMSIELLRSGRTRQISFALR